MAYELSDLELDEVSGVDVPAAQHAHVVLVKRVASESLSGYTGPVNPESAGSTVKGDGSVTVEELTKKLEGLQTQVADLTKAAEQAAEDKAASDAALAALVKSAEEAGLQVVDGQITKRAEPEYVEIDGEKVEKSLVPAPVLKALEKAASDIAEMQKRAAEVDLAKRGEAELPNLAGTPLTKGRLLAAVAEDAEMLQALKAADAAMAKNFEERGHGEQENLNPADKLETLAKAHAATHNVSYETAFAEVTKAGEGYELLRAARTTAN